MKAVFFHGLESAGPGGKGTCLADMGLELLAQKITYRDPEVVNSVWREALEFKPDVVVGSSMGGWMGLHLAAFLNVPAWLFNPAVVSRSLELDLPPLSNERPHLNLLLGKDDEVVLGSAVLQWMSDRGFHPEVTWADCGHRVPYEVYQPWFESLKVEWEKTASR